MVEIVTPIEFIVHRMKSRLLEERTDGHVLLSNCIPARAVYSCDLRSLVTELI